MTPGRDLDKPLVETDPAASRLERATDWLLRGYLGFLLAFYAVAVAVLVLLALVWFFA